MKEVSTLGLRVNLADILGDVCYGNNTYTITKRGKPVAVMSPVGFREEIKEELAKLKEDLLKK